MSSLSPATVIQQSSSHSLILSIGWITITTVWVSKMPVVIIFSTRKLKKTTMTGQFHKYSPQKVAFGYIGVQTPENQGECKDLDFSVPLAAVSSEEAVSRPIHMGTPPETSDSWSGKDLSISSAAFSPVGSRSINQEEDLDVPRKSIRRKTISTTFKTLNNNTSQYTSDSLECVIALCHCPGLNLKI